MIPTPRDDNNRRFCEREPKRYKEANMPDTIIYYPGAGNYATEPLIKPPPLLKAINGTFKVCTGGMGVRYKHKQILVTFRSHDADVPELCNRVSVSETCHGRVTQPEP